MTLTETWQAFSIGEKAGIYTAIGVFLLLFILTIVNIARRSSLRARKEAMDRLGIKANPVILQEQFISEKEMPAYDEKMPVRASAPVKKESKKIDLALLELKRAVQEELKKKMMDRLFEE